MADLIYRIVMWTAQVHDQIMAMNDGWGYYNNDKKLHFIVMGIIGMIVVLGAYFIFKLLQNHPLVIAFIYAFTVMIVLTFSIEIGQGFYGTGNMEMDDVVAGMAGFLFFFVIFALVRGIFMLFYNLIRGEKRKKKTK
ncbi:MAG: hypothetical protein Q4C18_05830 [Eubacteriales bacterium]|nr:hypothetical protein [Eubacteriales bacterium]